MATETFKNATGAIFSAQLPLAPGRVAAASSRPVTLSTEDKAALDSAVASLQLLDNVVSGNAFAIKDQGRTNLGFQAMTSLSASTAFTVPAGATLAVITVEGQAVRFRGDGVDPTATIGHRLPVDGPFVDFSGNLSLYRFKETALGGSIMVSYFGET